MKWQEILEFSFSFVTICSSDYYQFKSIICVEYSLHVTLAVI